MELMQTELSRAAYETGNRKKVVRLRVLVTGREIRLPVGNQVSQEPTGNRLTEQKFLNLFEIFEFERPNVVK